MRITSVEGLHLRYFCSIGLTFRRGHRLHLEVEKFRGRLREPYSPENDSALAVPDVKLHILPISEVIISHWMRLHTRPHSKGRAKMRLIAIVAGLLLLGAIRQADARGGMEGASATEADITLPVMGAAIWADPAHHTVAELMSIRELATVTPLIDKEWHMLPRSSQLIVRFGHATSQPPRSGCATRPIVGGISIGQSSATAADDVLTVEDSDNRGRHVLERYPKAVRSKRRFLKQVGAPRQPATDALALPLPSLLLPLSADGWRT
ncbi:hypothetical protein ABIG06_003650 [Bradyrhizobium sp. USDA 326]|uniref:hypothetical protein n=1 Tax=Bradyrhizobium TaxID=374 RepID=UPI0011CF8637|nr:hypothetical protein [Bradyrhizobium guangdongense]